MNRAKENARRISIFLAIISGICGILMLVCFGIYFILLNQFYYKLFFSILGGVSGVILLFAIVFWVRFLKLAKAERQTEENNQPKDIH